MNIEAFKEECVRIPELARMWRALAEIALNTQTRGLPLALLVYQGAELSEEEHQTYNAQQSKFKSAADELADACKTHGIVAPMLRAGEICALYS